MERKGLYLTVVQFPSWHFFAFTLKGRPVFCRGKKKNHNTNDEKKEKQKTRPISY